MGPYNSRQAQKKTLFSAETWHFLAIFGRKLIFFVLAALQHPIGWSIRLELVRHPENRVWGPKTHDTGQNKPVFGQKLAFFGHFGVKTDFSLCWRPCNTR